MSFDLEQEIEKIASTFETEAQRTAFKEGFYKEAMSFKKEDLSKSIRYNPAKAILSGGKGGLGGLAEPAIEGAGKALGALGVGILGTALAKGITSGYSSLNSSAQRKKFEQALAQVLANNRIVKASPDRAKQYAETIFKFGPNVAGDPNLLSSILAHVVQGEGVDTMIIKTIVDLEGRYKDNSSVQLPRW